MKRSPFSRLINCVRFIVILCGFLIALNYGYLAPEYFPAIIAALGINQLFNAGNKPPELQEGRGEGNVF